MCAWSMQRNNHRVSKEQNAYYLEAAIHLLIKGMLSWNCLLIINTQKSPIIIIWFLKTEYWILVNMDSFPVGKHLLLCIIFHPSPSPSVSQNNHRWHSNWLLNRSQHSSVIHMAMACLIVYAINGLHLFKPKDRLTLNFKQHVNTKFYNRYQLLVPLWCQGCVHGKKNYIIISSNNTTGSSVVPVVLSEIWTLYFFWEMSSFIPAFSFFYSD